MRPPPPDSPAPMLTLLKGGDPKADDSLPQSGLVPLSSPGGSWEKRPHVRTLARRPGDHVEFWSFEAVGTLRSLRREAREHGVNPDTAVSIVCERRLACAQLETLDLSPALAAVEQAAAAAEAPLSMWAANRAYLRHLRHGDPLERASQVPLSVPQAAVPIRLLEHLGEREILDIPLERAEFAEALRWEIAALCAGKLIGEWAYGIALAALVGRGTLAAAGAS